MFCQNFALKGWFFLHIDVTKATQIPKTPKKTLENVKWARHMHMPTQLFSWFVCVTFAGHAQVMSILR